MLSIVAFIVALLVFVVLFFSGGEGRKFGSFLADQRGGVGNRFAYGNVSNGLIAKILAELGLSSAFPPRSWSVPAWFVDPVNGSDGNDGLTAATPVKSYNGGIVKRWGTTAPTLRQNTTITWLTSQPTPAPGQPAADPVVFTPTMVNAVAIIQGVLGPAQQVHTGNLAAVVAKNRATAQLLTADLGAVVPIGSLVQNTTAGKHSFAEVYQRVGVTTTYILTQPAVPVVMPYSFFSIPAPVDTWANLDTFIVWDPVHVNIVKLDAIVAQFDVAASFANPVQLYHVRAASADGVPGDSNAEIESVCAVVESTFDSTFIQFLGGSDVPFQAINVFAGQGAFGNGFNSGTGQWIYGAIVSAPFSIGSAIPWSLSGDMIVDATPPGGIGAIVGAFGSTIPFNGQFYIAGHVGFMGDVNLRAAAIVWGPGTLDALSRTRVFYTAPAATHFLCAALLLNDAATGNPFTPATGVWGAQIALTAAAIDAAGGIVLNPDGAAFTTGSL